jgi:hypothetical protein
MSPFSIAVIFVLTVLFGLFSIVPFLDDAPDQENLPAPRRAKTI